MTRSVQFPQSRLRAGVARGDITPPVGIYHRMWGAALHDRSTGVHRPLTATALALAPVSASQPTEPEFWIAVDHCLLWQTEMEQLLAAVGRLAGVAPERLIVMFSHTHGAGLMDAERRDLPGGELIPAYLETMAATIAGLVTQARESLRVADIVYGTGRCGLAANRDYPDAETNSYVCGFHPDGPTDDTLVVARLTDEAGTLLATLVNYACHPTTLAWKNTLISPDFPGAMRELVEGVTGGPCFFVQGASGDLGPRENYVGEPEVADQHGRQLGYAVLATLESLPPPRQAFTYRGPVVSGATLGTWDFEAVDESRSVDIARYERHEVSVELPYRADLPTPAKLQADSQQWQQAELEARAAGDLAGVRDARAMVERATRRLTRLGQLPTGEAFPYVARLWHFGDAVWLALNGEFYHVLQRRLRAAVPQLVLIVGTIANGSHVWYLPDAESYGKGLYQEEASILARGSLELLIDALEERLRQIADRE